MTVRSLTAMPNRRLVKCDITGYRSKYSQYRETGIEILGFKHAGVMTLISQGHVTSSVTWHSTRHMPFPIGVHL